MLKRKLASIMLAFALVASVITGVFPQTSHAAATIQNYPMPSIYTPSSVFSLKADDSSVPVISYQNEYDYAEFSFSGTVTLEVTASQNITSYSISPAVKNIAGTVDGNKLTFTLSTSTYVIVRINDMKKLVIAADPLETDIPASSGPGIYNVKSAPYNADSTGTAMATTAIQKAIDDATNAGGGTVYVPAGVYKSGNLTLKSNVTLYMAGGSVIVATGKGSDYTNDFNKSSLNMNGTYFIRTATDSSNITMRGRGTIDGKGAQMRSDTKFLNNLLVPVASTNFKFEGLTLRDGGFWAFMVVRCDNVSITNYKGYQSLNMLEDDAIDINESQNVLVKHAVAISDDDSFSTKTWMQTGMSINWPGTVENLENVVFDDCLAWSNCVGFKVGQGAYQLQRNVTFKNSYVFQSSRALVIDHSYGTPPVENVTYENIDIEKCGMNKFGNYWFGVMTSTVGPVNNVKVKRINVRDTGSQSSRISGHDPIGSINGVTFSDVYILGKLATSLTELKAVLNNSYVNNVIIANSKPPLYSDNFDDGDSAGWTPEAGSWSVTADDAKSLTQAGSAASLITAGQAWTDYVYEAKIQLPAAGSEAGLAFRVTDSNNYYLYKLNAAANKLELYKSVNGVMTSVSSTDFTAAPSQWYTLKVVAEGNHITGYVDGALQTDWTNPATELGAGKIGLWTASANAAFDDVIVASINRAPTDISLTNNIVAENTTAGSVVGVLGTTDPDASESFYYMLVPGEGDADNGSFSILGSNLSLGITPDYEAKDTYTVRVRATDSGGLNVEKAFTIHVIDVDETPTNANPYAILFSDDFEDGDSIGWKSASGTWGVLSDDTKVLVQKVSTTALITTGDTSWTDYIYEAKMKVSISNANVGMVFRLMDASNFYMYRINASTKKLELYKNVNGTMTNVSSTTFAAAAKTWYTVKVLARGNNIRCYVDGVLQTEWTNPATELTAGKIGFRTTSADVYYDDVVVSGINKEPSDITLSNNSVEETAAPGSAVGTLTTVDPDAVDTFTYELATGAGDYDNGSFTIAGDTLQTASVLDYNTQSSYSIRVRSTDAGGAYVEKAFTIAVTPSGVNPVLADASLNTAALDRSSIALGEAVTITATGDRQSADGLAAGDEKFVPAAWASTEAGQSGSFAWNQAAGAYTSSYSPLAAGAHTVTVAFQKMVWDGSAWVNGATDTKTAALQVYSPTNSAGNSLIVSPSQIVVGQMATLTAEGNRQNAAPTAIGDERYYPIGWSSTESGKSGAFTVTGQVYQAEYTPSVNGVFTITATYQLQIWDGTDWVNGATDTHTAALTVLPVTVPPVVPVAQAANNTVALNASTITAGGGVTITAAGDRQNAAGTLTGEERYVPVSWSSTEAGKSGAFAVSGGVYSSGYTPAAAGSYTITAVFQKQSWSGSAWVNGATDSKTVHLSVNAASTGGGGGGGTPAAPAANTGADILVNGKAEQAGTVTTKQEGGKTVTTVSLDAGKLEQKLSQENKGVTVAVAVPVTEPSDAAVFELTGALVKSMQAKEAVLQLQTESATYTLPAAAINLDAVSGQIGTAWKDMSVSIHVAASSESTVQAAQATARKNSYELVVSPVEFDITFTGGGKSVEVSKFNSFVERTLALPEGVDAGRITTGIVVNTDGTFSHVPTTITVKDGKTYAKVNSLTNSAYSVIYSPKAFADVNGHWAKDTVNDMASRLILDGGADGRFEPDKDMTRAEFAAIMVKGLGLMRPGAGKDIFKDVAKGSWYYDAVALAYENGIIDGYEDGRFGPADKISREQAMTMAARAMKLAGMNVSMSGEQVKKLLSGYGDAGSAAEYAKAGVASCIEAGIVTGREGNLVAPHEHVTRAEVAVMVKRLLQKSGLI